MARARRRSTAASASCQRSSWLGPKPIAVSSPAPDTAMRAVRREAGGGLVAGNARFELRFRLNFKKVRNEEAAEAVREAESLVLAAERVAPARGNRQ